MTNSLNRRIKWLLVDIGDVLLLKNDDTNFVELLAEELAVDGELAQSINKLHYTMMETRFVPEAEFVSTLQNELKYKAPSDIFSYFARAYAKRVRPNTALLQFLDEARSSGLKTAVLSNTIAIYSDVQKSLGISKEAGFDPIIYSWEVGMAKPSTKLFTLALEKLNAQPDEILFVDDKSEYANVAKNLGMKVVTLADTKNALLEIRQLLDMPVNGHIASFNQPGRSDYLFRVSLKSVILNDNGEVLVVKEKDRDWWDLPGGGMDHGESVKDALARELHEEVSMKGGFDYETILTEDPRYLTAHNLYQMRITFFVKPAIMKFSKGIDSDEIAFMNPDLFKDSEILTERKIYEYCMLASERHKTS